MTNTKKLKARMVEYGFTQKPIAKRLGISTQSFNYKLNGKLQFKGNEIAILCEILNIESNDIPEYFFVRAVPEKSSTVTK